MPDNRQANIEKQMHVAEMRYLVEEIYETNALHSGDPEGLRLINILRPMLDAVLIRLQQEPAELLPDAPDA